MREWRSSDGQEGTTWTSSPASPNLGRLEALDKANLAREPLRPELDRLAESAATQLGTPMAFMSLLDDKRVFLAGAAGITGEMAEIRQNSVKASYGQYVVAFDDVFVVDSLVEDPLVVDNPGTIEGGVRAYLGVPLRYEGHCLGSFCVVDTEPRRWTDDDLEVLTGSADQAVSHVR